MKKTIAERFWEKVDKGTETDGCWLWIGAKSKSGYGQIRTDKKCDYAHKVSYSLYNGEIPEGRNITHICPNRNCVRPDHLILEMTYLEFFWSRVQKTETCWLWEGPVNKKGYGNFHLDGKSERTHRISYILAYGPIPEGMVIRHTCDTPPCIKPEHLLLGSHNDNVQDAVNRERNAYGERMGTAILTEEQVLIIRAEYATGKFQQKELADMYGVARQTIGNIVNSITWKHLDIHPKI